MLKIHETGGADGSLNGVFLRCDEQIGGLELVDVEGSFRLPDGALEKVLARYGAPFNPDARIVVVAELALGAGRRLRQVQHLAGYDVVPRDYLVLELGDGEAVCAMATTVAGALQHLARVAAARL